MNSIATGCWSHPRGSEWRCDLAAAILRSVPVSSTALTYSFRGAVNNELCTIGLHRARSARVLPGNLACLRLQALRCSLVWDAVPRVFRAGVMTFSAAYSLVMIAVAYLVYQIVHRPAGWELAKAAMLAIAFLFWLRNQLWVRLATRPQRPLRGRSTHRRRSGSVMAFWNASSERGLNRRMRIGAGVPKRVLTEYRIWA